jgi:hypothetical protein
MEKYKRLCTGDTMSTKMRPAIAMIELVFAIVIISISVITIPSMMAVAGQATKAIVLDEDVMARLSGWALDKFQGRWDGRYMALNSAPLNISSMNDLNCSRDGGYRIGSDDNVSSIQCNIVDTPSNIPALGDGNVSRGIEQLNGGSETITVTPTNGTPYDINATYSIRYVTSTVTTTGNTQTANWVLGSSDNLSPDGSLNNPTHLKRVVTRFDNPTLGVSTTLTFFKSNKGN